MPLTQTRWPLFVALLVGGLGIAVFAWMTAGNQRGEAVPASGGSYVEAVFRPPERINPLFSYANSTDGDLAALVFSGLVQLAPDGLPQPNLAERWEVTDSGRRYVFHLRRGIAWHDGEEFDAEDVEFTYRAMADPGFNGDPYLAQMMQGVVVTSRDPLTVEFRLEEAFSPFLSRLTVGILPRHLLGEVDVSDLLNSPFNLAPVGTGPYRFQMREVDGTMRLTANSTYHFGPPHISRIEFRVYASQVAVIEALRSGEADGALLGEDATTAEIDALRGDGRWNASDLSGVPYYILFLDTRSPLFSDADVRKALFQAVDRSALVVRAADGRGTVAATGIPVGSWAASSLEFPPFSPGDAATILEQEGFFRGRDGTRSNVDNVRLAFTILTADAPYRVDLADLIASQLRQVGVTVAVEQVPAAEISRERLQMRDYEAALVLIDPGPDPDPYAFWHSSQIPPPGLNLANFRDTRIDRVIEDARKTTDFEDRKQRYQLFDGYFIVDMPSIPLYAPASTYVQSTRIHGFETGLQYTPASRFAQVEDWYINTRYVD